MQYKNGLLAGVVTVICLFYINSAKAIHLLDTLSHQAKVTILTVEPGKELYSLFGHTAIRIQDPSTQLDIAFNYGTFHFEMPQFIWSFLRGNQDYFLSVVPTKYEWYQYHRSQRTVWEQVLNLSVLEKEVLYSKLVENAQKENKYYRYDFLFDNCATRVRNVIHEALIASGSTLSLASDTMLPTTKTFRDLLAEYIEAEPLIYMGMNLLIGTSVDRVASYSEQQFLPDYLQQAFNNTQVSSVGNTQKQLVQTNRKVLYGHVVAPSFSMVDFLLDNVLWLILIAMVLYTIVSTLKKRIWWGVDATLFLMVGIVGCFLVLMWVGSLHTTVRNNWNIMWAMPIYVLLGTLLLFKKKRSQRLIIYFVLSEIGLIVTLIGWRLIPQTIPVQLVPIILVLLIRTIWLHFFIQKNKLL